jgi:hypothetical protein
MKITVINVDIDLINSSLKVMIKVSMFNTLKRGRMGVFTLHCLNSLHVPDLPEIP